MNPLLTFCTGLMIGGFAPPLIAKALYRSERPRRMNVDEILATIPRQRTHDQSRKP
jgi:hypothetical protein